MSFKTWSIYAAPISAALIVLALWAGSKSDDVNQTASPPQHQAAQQQPAQQQLAQQQLAPDRTSATVASCAYDEVSAISISSVSVQDTVAICEKMTKSMGRHPSVNLLQKLSKAASILSLKGYGADIVGSAYQFMRIAESRGQLNDETAINSTIDTVFKIVTGTDGRVTPKDLNIFLSSLGHSATQMSDEGLINSASLLSVMKQDRGE